MFRLYLYSCATIVMFPLMFLIGGISFRAEFYDNPILMMISIIISIIFVIETMIRIGRN